MVFATINYKHFIIRKGVHNMFCEILLYVVCYPKRTCYVTFINTHTAQGCIQTAYTTAWVSVYTFPKNFLIMYVPTASIKTLNMPMYIHVVRCTDTRITATNVNCCFILNPVFTYIRKYTVLCRKITHRKVVPVPY